MVKILAPAGSLEGCAAVLNAGAHGVYVGAKYWSRGSAPHALADSDIARCIDFAGSAGKPVHVAVNVIPAHGDVDMLVEKCLRYAALGAGGLILNDFGLMAKLLSVDANLPVYASVGCGVSNIADVEFYLGLGVAGVVLPPGVLPAGIKEMKEKRAFQVEVFCEVLLEPFQFGRCWLGGYCSLSRKRTGGREFFYGSAKRGGCARACKARWEVFRGSGLPAGDCELAWEPFSLLVDVKACAEAGVDIIKIQGRELAPEAVVETVIKYKRALARLHAGGSS
ncbi:MAG: U32 family peptidase [Peptococcaceae bacterium]|nr:U32 family peptidase [Peptococcaceae bacterium]